MNVQRWLGVLTLFCLMMGCDESEDKPPVDTLDFELVEGCDPLVPGVCAFPFPSSYYQIESPDTDTGYRIQFGEQTLPASSITGDHMSPELFRFVDGFGLGTMMYTLIPNLDASNLPNETQIEDSIGEDGSLILLEVGENGTRRIACWAELDAGETDPQTRALLISPAELLKPNHQYIVALRNLADLEGMPILPTPATQALLDGATRGTPMADRQVHFDAMIEKLETSGIAKSDIQVIWDFHTASKRSLHEPMTSLFSRALEVTGQDGPELVINDEDIETFLESDDGSGTPFHPDIAYRISARIIVPQYVRQSEPLEGTSGWVLNRDENDEIIQNGTAEVPVLIGIPRSALTGTPQKLLAFGHGNFQDRTEGLDIDSDGGCGIAERIPCKTAHSRLYNANGYIYFATDMLGMAREDYDQTILAMLIDLNAFPWLSDRLHQGMLNRLLVTRMMAKQFATHPKTLELGITMAHEDVYYWGLSGGAILGGSFAALSPDVKRAVLGVFGMNWVSVLWRSRQFIPLFEVLQTPYANRLDQIVTFGSLQLLWDPTDSVNFMRNLISDPIDGRGETPTLVDITTGDQSVPPILAENLARSNVGIPLMENYDDERNIALTTAQAYPHTGSGITVWHTGADWAQDGNQPPLGDYPDTHGDSRQLSSLHRQIGHFFDTGEIIDVCEGGICPTQTELGEWTED